MMFSFTDITLLVILLVFAASGYRRGLVRAVTGLLSLVASFVLAWMLFRPVVEFLNTTLVRTWIQQAVRSHYVEPGIQQAGGSFGSLPAALQSMVDNGTTAFSEAMSTYVTDLIMQVIAFLAVLILVKVLIFVAMRILGILAALPVLSFFNKILGFFAGLLSGLAVVYILLAVCFAAPPVRESPSVRYALERSVVAKSMYQNNPIVDWIFPAMQETGQSL